MPTLITYSEPAYTYDQLEESAKQRALEELWDINVDYEWWESCYECIKEGFDGFSGEPNGFDIDRSVCVTFKSLNLNTDVLAERLMCENKPNIKGKKSYKLYFSAARIIKSGDFGVYLARNNPRIDSGYLPWYLEGENVAIAEEFLESALSDFTHKCIKMLENEYEYLTSREAIEESIVANEYTFDDKGNLI